MKNLVTSGGTVTASNWKDVRARSGLDKERVAAHTERMLAEVRAHRLAEIRRRQRPPVGGAGGTVTRYVEAWERCINCKQPGRDGKINHLRSCPDYRPDAGTVRVGDIIRRNR
jgi:hypothetical protein